MRITLCAAPNMSMMDAGVFGIKTMNGKTWLTRNRHGIVNVIWLVVLFIIIGAIATVVLAEPATTKSSAPIVLDESRNRVALQHNPTTTTTTTTTVPKRIVQPVATQPPVAITGTKHDWLTASGIPQIEWHFVDYLVGRESGWNPNAVNASSGACGLGQQLPCGKWPNVWNEPVGALIDMNNYVVARYGSWLNAVGHSKSRGWY